MQSNALVFIQWMAELIPLISLQLIAILILRKPVCKYFGAKTSYQLWLLPPLWCLMLWITERWDLWTIAGLPAISIVVPDLTTLTITSFSNANNLDGLINMERETTTIYPALWSSLFFIWVLGFTITTAFSIYKAFRFHLLMKKSAPQEMNKNSRKLLATSGFSDSLTIRTLDNLSGPAIYGIWKPCLLLPKDWDGVHDTPQQQAVLCHEAMHYFRHDNAINLIALLLRNLLWFNPIAIIAHHYFRLDQELSCDAHVLKRSTSRQRNDYARALLSSASGKKFSSFQIGISAWDNVRELKERAVMINRHHKIKLGKKSRLSILLGLIIIGTLGCSVIVPEKGNKTNSPTSYVDSLDAEKISVEMLALLSEDNQQNILESAGKLPPIPIDSEYLIFVIDTSGSMLNYSWEKVTNVLLDTLDLYPNLKGFQVMSDMGVYLLPSSAGEWIPDSVTMKESVSRELITWNTVSNSSPLEGIELAIKTFSTQQQKISIYVLGDDFVSSLSAQQITSSLEKIMVEISSNNQFTRIHSKVFPTLLDRTLIALKNQRSVNNYISLMLSLTQQNGGTFELFDLEESL